MANSSSGWPGYLGPGVFNYEPWLQQQSAVVAVQHCDDFVHSCIHWMVPAMKPTMTVSKDFTENFNAIIKRFKNDVVLVGIPEDTSQREDSDTINNATLLAINNFGSPAQNIPPRPVMAIGIRNAQEEIAEQYKQAAVQSLKTGFQALDTYYNRAGIIASNSIKKAINDQEGFDPPADATIYAREHRKPTPFKGTKALIVTGQMRNAITYVIGGRK